MNCWDICDLNVDDDDVGGIIIVCETGLFYWVLWSRLGSYHWVGHWVEACGISVRSWSSSSMENVSIMFIY